MLSAMTHTGPAGLNFDGCPAVRQRLDRLGDIQINDEVKPAGGSARCRSCGAPEIQSSWHLATLDSMTFRHLMFLKLIAHPFP